MPTFTRKPSKVLTGSGLGGQVGRSPSVNLDMQLLPDERDSIEMENNPRHSNRNVSMDITPGNIGNSNIANSNLQSLVFAFKMPKKRYCEACQMTQLFRSKHCFSCEACIAKFDHHCHVIGVCIGELNVRYFWGVLASMATLFALVFVNVSSSVTWGTQLQQ